MEKETRDSRDEEIRDYHKKVKRNVKVLNVLTLVAIILDSITLLIVIIYSLTNPLWDGGWSTMFTGILYLSLGLSFAIVSYEIIQELKKQFTDFYT